MAMKLGSGFTKAGAAATKAKKAAEAEARKKSANEAALKSAQEKAAVLYSQQQAEKKPIPSTITQPAQPSYANFWEDPNYQKGDKVGQEYILPNGEFIVKGENGWSLKPTKKITLPDGSTATVRNTTSFISKDDEWIKGFDPEKLGSLVYTDKGTFVSYSKDFLDGKVNVQRKDGVTTVLAPTEFNKNSKASFNGTGEFEGSVLVPYSGSFPINKSSYDNAQDPNWDSVDTDLVGKTIQMPDGSFQTISSISKSTAKSQRYGASYDGAAVFNTLGNDNKVNQFAYYDESFLKGERRGGDGKNGWYSTSSYLSSNKDKASAVDFSGVGSSLSSGLGSKGVFVPYDGKSSLSSAYEYYTKSGIFGGGFLGEVASDFAGLLNNPVLQLGVSTLVPGGAAIVAGYNAGNALANGGIGAAIKAGAVGLIAGKAGSLASGAVGSVGNSIVDNALKGAIQGSTEGLVGSALTGGDLGKGIVAGLIGGTAGGLASGIVNQVFPSVPKDTIDGTIEVEPEAEISGGAGAGLPNNVGDLNLGTGSLLGNTNISPIGINAGNFKPDVIDPLNPNFNNLGGSFGSDPKLLDPTTTTPKLGSDGGIGLTIPLYNADGTLQGYQGTGGSVGTQFNTPLGNPSSFVNNPVVTGQPLVNNGGVTPTPDFNSSLTDLANNNIGTGTQQPTNNVTPQPVGQQNTSNDFLKSLSKDVLTNLFKGLLAGGVKNTLTQPIGTGQNTGANMADYSGLIGNILSQNTQINRLQDTGNQIAGSFNQAAADINKPFTPFNITSGAGSTQVQGQNINQTLSGGQQQLADLAGTAAGMFGDVNIPNAENIRNTALQGSQNLLQQAQGFNPQSAAQQEFSALQELYAPQRERDRLALENRLRMQGRLGASENPALRQLEETFRQQDLQSAIQSRNLGFERQQQLQNLSQGMFNQGSQAAKLPTELQAVRAQIGNAAGMLSQQPFQTANQQAQLANQLAATQATQGTSLASSIAGLRGEGLKTQAGIASQAAALQNARDVAALQGLFGSGGNQGGVGGVINQAGNAVGNAVGGLLESGIKSAGGYLKGLFTGIGASEPYIPAANLGLTSAAINAMSDDDFLQFLINGGGTYGTSEGE